MNDIPDALSAIRSDAFAGRPGSYTFDPSTGKRVRNVPAVVTPAPAPLVDPDQPEAAVAAQPETQGHDQENT